MEAPSRPQRLGWLVLLTLLVAWVIVRVLRVAP